MSDHTGAKLESIISGYAINEDDADWLRALRAPAAPIAPAPAQVDEREAERERCAKLCDEKFAQHAANGFPREASTARALAAAIRARQPQPEERKEG